MIKEREKLATIKPLYKTAKVLLPKLSLSKHNTHYYASLVHYYSIHELRKRLNTSQTYLYLLCYVWLRYQQLTDNLIDAFCYQLKQFEKESKENAKEAFYQYKKEAQREDLLMRGFATYFIDERFPNETQFGKVREQAFKSVLPEDELRNTLFGPNSKPKTEMDFRWESISKLGHRFKNQLRPLALALDFTAILPNNPWLNALAWFKTIFTKQESLNQQPLNNCPEGTLPKRLRHYLLELNEEGIPIKLQPERYEFWIYRQLKKRLAGELYLEDSICHRCLEQELVSLENKDAIIQTLDIPALRQPIEELLDEKFYQLHALWIEFNMKLRNGELTHLRYDEVTKTLHLRKLREDNLDEFQQQFYAQFPLCDLADVLQLVNEQCHYLSALTHIQPRYAKQPADKKSLLAVIMAQALNHSHLKMADICNIPYHDLQDTYQSYMA